MSIGMRKVVFNKWIVGVRHPDNTSFYVKGTQCWETEFKNEGLFHEWGNAYEEFESGPGNFTVALVETPDGFISEVLPQHIKFVK